MVGEELSMVAWLVIQHSRKETLEKYFPIILKANKEKDLDDIYIALMTDRLRMYKGEKQIYGTQVSGKMIFNKISQREEWVNFIWPIENPEKVNELRKKVGFTPTGKIITIEKLVNSISIPCLVYRQQQQQFLILEKIDKGLEGDRFHIIEISGKKEYDKKQFLMNWGYIRYDKEEEYRGLIIELF